METVRVMVDMSATLVHYGHVRLLKRAKECMPDKDVKLVVGLTSDQEVKDIKGYTPELNFEERKELLEAIKYVDEVVSTPWLITQDVLDQNDIDFLVHGSDNSNDIENIIVFPRTEGVSSEELRERAVRSIVQKRNSNKPMFTPGPSNMSYHSMADIRPVFGREDNEYLDIEEKVLENIKKLTSHENIVRLQGSATTAIEVATSNFVLGEVLIIDAGYYSHRLIEIYERKLSWLKGTKITVINYDQIEKEMQKSRKFDWIATTYAETSNGFLCDIHKLFDLKKVKEAKLFLDATASINLEEEHFLSDACAFSSCKGLMGLTGAGFITYNSNCLNPKLKPTLPFVLDMDTYINKSTTGPYHALCSMDTISENFKEMRANIKKSKEYFAKKHEDILVIPEKDQPVISTVFKINDIKFEKGIPYSARVLKEGTSIVCHLGDAFTEEDKIGKIYDDLTIS